VSLNVGELVAHLRVGAEGMREGLTDGESRFRKFSDKLVGLAAAGGLLIGGALMAGLVSAMDQDAIGAKIAAQQGQGTAEGKKYGALAGKLWAEGWGESVQAVGDTLNAVVGAGLVSDTAGNDMESLTRQAQILADVMGADVTGSVNAVQQMIRTGLVPDAKSGFDLIAAGMQGGVDKAEDLTDTFNEYGTQFRKLGLDGATAMGLLQQGLKGGARDADLVADAFKEFSIRAIDGSTASADGFKALGLDAKQMTAQIAKGGTDASSGLQLVLTKLKGIKDPAAQAAAATALFGTQSEDLGKALFGLDLPSATAAFNDVAGAVDKAGKTVGETDSAKLEKFKRSAMQAATTLAADLVPSLAAMGKWIKQNEDWLKPLGVTLGIVTAAIIAINLATRAWTAAQAAWASVQGIATAAQWLFNAAIWASPITWIVIGIIALIAVIVLIATKTTWFQQAWNWAWGGIKAGAMAVWGWLKDVLWPGIQWLWDKIVAGVVWVKDRWVSGFQAVVSFLTSWKNMIKSVFDAVGDFIAAGFNRGKDAARGAINGIIGFVNGAIGGINRLIEGANKIPGINIGTIGSIPKLASGGKVMPNGRAGTPVIMGDGGEVEYGIPKSDMRQIIGEAVSASRRHGGSSDVTLRFDFGRFRKAFVGEVSRRGGSAEVVLSPGRA
jgi:phage-related minor tail protein